MCKLAIALAKEKTQQTARQNRWNYEHQARTVDWENESRWKGHKLTKAMQHHKHIKWIQWINTIVTGATFCWICALTTRWMTQFLEQINSREETNQINRYIQTLDTLKTTKRKVTKTFVRVIFCKMTLKYRENSQSLWDKWQATLAILCRMIVVH